MVYNIELLHTSRQNPALVRILKQLMDEELLKEFRLVGGTNLALKHDHRYSVNIDRFTDSEYGCVDFNKIRDTISSAFPYFEFPETGPVSFGRSFFAGNSKDEAVKIDLMYTEKFLDEPEIYGNIRMASDKDIVAMKMEAVNSGPRKKDFWDLHYLLNSFSLPQMLDIHKKRYPYNHDRAELLDKFVSFTDVDNEPDPISYEDTDWTEIKLDLIEEYEKII